MKMNKMKFSKSISVLLIMAGILMPFQTVSSQKKKGKKQEMAIKKPEIILAQNGNSLYRIVVPSNATAQEQKAASVLQDYLLQISGAAIPIVSATRPTTRYEILLGQNEKLAEHGIDVNFSQL